MLENMGLLTIIIIFVTLVISISLHEAMHAFMAHWLGDTTASELGRISLNPLKHIDPFATVLLPLITLVLFGVPLLAAKPVPFNPSRVKFEEYGAALVGFAGPLTNLLLSIFGAGVLFVFSGFAGELFNQILIIFIQLNIAIFVFNMIPIPPLDGSRVLYSIAPESVQNIMAGLEQYGILIVFGLVLAVPSFTNILININQSLFRLLV